MNKIINELLNTNARVIIPDFGAFIIKQKNPRLVVFNEFLRYNDGLLIDYISVSEGIEKSAAKAKVTKFIEETNQKLSLGDEVIIEGLGKLMKDSTGKLTFSEQTEASAELQQKAKKTTARKDTTSEAPPKAKPVQKKAEKVKQEKETAESRKEKIEETKSKEEKPVEITFEKEDIKAAPPKEEKIMVTPVKTSDVREESGKDTRSAPAGKRPAEKTTRKNNSMQILVWIILIVLVNAAIVAWFLFNDQITGIFRRDKMKQYEITTGTEAEQKSPADEQVDLPDEATETQTESDVQQKIEQDIKAPDIPPVSQPVLRDRKEYYIVAGCFREESNADQLVIELRKKGFQAEKFGKIGNLHAVSFSSFADKSTALEELKKIRNTEQEGAWIAYY
ncbi:MAG TPA: SPOR domain-containing protein [Bacteroidales bacterium]|nr:SPOR domain-containing protein [Bacteroidales bacterium]